MSTAFKLQKLFFLLSLGLVLSACELTEEELANVDRIIGEDQNPGSNFDYEPVQPNCHQQIFRQPEAQISRKVDLLFVLDTSGSLDAERQQIGQGVDAFLAALPVDVDAHIGVVLGHVGARSGQLYRRNNASPLVLKTSDWSREQIRSELSHRMRYTAGEGASDGGEALLYSYHQLLEPANVARARNEGLFRDEAALVVVFVTDENDICARYPEGITPVPDPERKEESAFRRYCADVTPESVLEKTQLFMAGKPVVLSGIIYHPQSQIPRGAENEIGYGILELVEQSSGALIDLAGGNFHIGLEQIGSLAVKKLQLKTDFVLTSSNIDPNTFDVRVDNQSVAFAYNEALARLSLTDYAGIENSEVFIAYCEQVEDVEKPTPVLSDLRVSNITAGSALVEWRTDLPASSQLRITHVASGAEVLTNLSPGLKLDHSIRLQGLNPDTLYRVQAISVLEGQEGRSVELSFRTGRALN